jgi:hypothetical protein
MLDDHIFISYTAYLLSAGRICMKNYADIEESDDIL